MPIDLNARTLRRTRPHAAIRDQLADRFRQAIAAGELVADELLPSEEAMSSAVGVNLSTLRQAIEDCANEGLLIKSRGRPTIVAPAPVVRRMDTTRYRDQLAQLRAGGGRDTAFITDHGATWDDHTVDPCTYLEEAATETDARYLQVPIGTQLLRRHMVKLIQGVPIQVQRSAVPLDLAAGTVLADPTAQPYPGGTLAELYDAGLIPDGAALLVAEEAAGRTPTPADRDALRLPTAAPAWDIYRVFHVNGRPVEVSRVIAPLSTTALRYETAVT